VEVEPVMKTIDVKVENETVSIDKMFYKCKECGYDEIEDKENQIDELELAYREYRRKHGLLQPEEIVALRERYGLSQESFAKLLGISIDTLKRYEDGGLQDKAHNNLMLLLLEDPDNMLTIISKNMNSLTDEEKEKIISLAGIERKKMIKVSENEWVNPDKIASLEIYTFHPDYPGDKDKKLYGVKFILDLPDQHCHRYDDSRSGYYSYRTVRVEPFEKKIDAYMWLKIKGLI